MPGQTLATSLLPDEGYFTGRESELARLKILLAENKLVVLEGLAGIGKTALTLHYTYQTATDYEAVVWHEVQPGDSVESVLVSIAAQLSDQGHEALLDAVTDPKMNWLTRMRTLIEALRDLRVLLVLDSFNNCLDDTHRVSAGFAPLVDQLLGQTYASRVLLTTKIRPQISPAHLGKYVTYELDGLQYQEAVPLFLALCEGVGHDADEEEASQVCRAAGGHPFAIRIIVGLLHQGYLLSSLLDQMRGRVISDYGQFLLDIFYTRLARGAKRLLEACSVFRRSVRLTVIEQLPVDSKLIDQLLPYFLLELEPRSRQYFMHTIVREYAYDKLVRDEERRRRVHKAAGDYYASAMGDPLRQRDFGTVQRVLEAQYHYREAEDQAGMVATAAYLADELKPLVRQLYREGKNELAGNLYRAILAMDEQDAEAHYYYGRLLEKQRGAPDEIEQHYREAVRLAPRIAERQMRYLVWLVKSKKYTEAHRAFNTAVKECGYSVDIYVPYAKALCESDRQLEAAAVLKEGLGRVLPEQNLFSLYVEYSDVLWAQGKLEEAAAALKEGLKRVPPGSLAPLYQEYSGVLQAQGKLEEAAAALKEGLKRVPRESLAPLYQEYSQVLRAQGKLEEAAAALKEGLERVPRESLAPLYLEYSQVLRAQGKLEEAAAALKEGLGRVPPEQNLFTLYVEYSQVLRTQGKLEEVAAVLKEGLGRVPPDATLSFPYSVLASILCDLGRGDEANSILRDGIERIQQPQAGYLITALANNLRRVGDYEAASAELRRGIERWPRLYKPYVILSVNLRAQGKFEEAENVLLTAMNKVPTEQLASLHLALAQLYEQQGDFGKAQDYYKKAIQVKPHPVSCVFHARFLWRLGQAEQASEMFKLALSQRTITGSFWPLVYRSYAIFLLHTDKQDRARQVLAQGFSLQADSAEIDEMISELSAITIEQITTSAEEELLAAESEGVPWELQVESLVAEPAAEVTEQVGVPRVAVVPPEPMPAVTPSPIVNILHISDIHRGSDAPTSNRTLLGKLLDDIRRTYDEDNAKLGPEEPRLGPPDIIVVSGDLTQRAAAAEYDLARKFLEGLLELTSCDRERVVLVPGNHDVNWTLSKKSYVPATEPEFNDQPVYDEPYRQMVKKERDAKVYWYKNEETYTERFRPFKTFFDDFYQGTAAAYTYPLDRDWMYTVCDYGRMYGLVIVGFNTCDEIDHLDRRAFINTDAIYRAENDPAFHAGEAGLLRIAVFHHNIRPVQHGEDFLDPKYLQILKLHGFDLCLHGHVHTAGLDIFDPTQAKTLPVLGAGSLAAPYKDRPPAAPKGYNLIVINRENGGIFAHTRCHDEDHLVWKADYQWDGKPYVTVRPPAHGNTAD